MTLTKGCNSSYFPLHRSYLTLRTQLFAVASCMNEGRGRGRVQKFFEDF
jgi:hypothetical protein